MSVFKTLKHVAILIAVDATSNVELLYHYLTGSGFLVLEANSGKQVFQLLKIVKPDIILLDVKLPDISGFETCSRLKANETTKNIPVIFITGQTNTVDKVHGFALGAVDYITKPIQSEEVLARLKTHLTIQSLQHTLEQQNLQLQEEIAEREKLIKELDAFAHTVAHNLKDPLGVTVNYAQFMLNYRDQMSVIDQDQYAERIIRNGQKMGTIIDELLLLASVRTEKIELDPLDMAPIVAEVQSRVAYMVEEYKAQIIVPSDWPLAAGYGPWVEEVWANYISNAIKYGGQPPRVELGATPKQNNMIEFWVRDNGPGLTLEAQSQLFLPFRRLDPTKTAGHGLGLSIVQRIVHRLGGTVAVESDLDSGNGGSIFSFSLPQATGV